eukprot:TRINITY_DN6559_c0_g1_i1.p1 TRINITY_DN6559_c0_g1~~TRINITY_DN6559_c0_g1_i1.p1  ORF type:complete len:701 (+),score=136.95 TRINITY_DN6559_c0_g1_i1:1-2103(+)
MREMERLLFIGLIGWVLCASGADYSKRSYKDIDIDSIIFGVDADSLSPDYFCHLDLTLFWHHSLDDFIYSTPLITNNWNSKSKNIITLTNHFLHVNEGKDGDEIDNFPFGITFSPFVSSPTMYDIDNDLEEEIVVVTENAEVIFIRKDGTPVSGKSLIVPPMYIKQDWGEGVSYTPNKEKVNVQEKKSDFMDYFQAFRADKIFDRFTDEGIRSLDLFVPSGGYDMVSDKEKILSSTQYDEYLRYIDNTQSQGVELKPHVLSNPIIVDLDGDLRNELVLAVSYYDDDHLSNITTVASGIIIFDLEMGEIKHKVRLDLTHEEDIYKGYIYADMAVGDLDKDGKSEIIVASGTGMIYIISHDGKPRNPGSMTLDSIFSGVVVDDINSDGFLEIIVTDTSGNIVVFDHMYQEIWENLLSGYTTSTPVLGDIDRDGILDVVAVTHNGHVYALNGLNGKILDGFPIKIPGEITSPIQLFPLDPNIDTLHILVHSSDGKLYIINHLFKCIEKIDLGDDSRSKILFSDLTDNGYYDMLISTLGGGLYQFSTSVPYQKLGKWHSTNNGINQYAVDKYPTYGVIFSEDLCDNNEISGTEMRVNFEIIDKHRVHSPKNNVRIRLGNALLFEGDLPSGKHSVSVPLPPIISSVVMKVEISNHMGQISSDEVTLHINSFFYKPLKFVVILPFLFFCFVVWFWRTDTEEISLGE